MMSYIFFEDATDKVTKAEREEKKTRIEERKREGKTTNKRNQREKERQGQRGTKKNLKKYCTNIRNKTLEIKIHVVKKIK